MNSFFITNKDKRKIDILHSIIFSDTGIPMNVLNKEFHLSDETLRRDLLELNNDLFHLFNDEIRIVKTNDLYIKVDIKIDSTIDFIVASLKRYYMKDTLIFVVLSALLQKKYTSVVELSLDVNFSEGAVYKALSKIKTLLLPFESEINLSDGQNIKGNEIGTRYFLYLTYWHLLGIFNEENIFNTLTPEFGEINYITQMLGLNRTLSMQQQEKILALYRITSYRLVVFKSQANVSDEFLSDIYPFYNGKLSLNLQTYNISLDTLEKESILMSFSLRGLISDIDSNDNKKLIVNRYQQSDINIAKDVSYFIDLIQNRFSINYSKKMYIEVYYRVVLMLLYHKHLGFDVDDYLSVPISVNMASLKKDSRYIRLEPLIEKLLADKRVSKLFPPGHENQVYTFIYTVVELGKKLKPIKIYVIHPASVIHTAYIKNEILKILNEDTIIFCDIPEEADVIVSNVFVGDLYQKDFFCLEDIFNKDTWSCLISFLTKKIYEKNYE